MITEQVAQYQNKFVILLLLLFDDFVGGACLFGDL
jgi:hypothetical protein